MNYLKCDNPRCDHVEEIDKLRKEMIGKPCPKCGESLLTERDYKIGRRIEVFLAILKFFRLAKPAVPGEVCPPGYREVAIQKHADGRYRMKDVEND